MIQRWGIQDHEKGHGDVRNGQTQMGHLLKIISVENTLEKYTVIKSITNFVTSL
jgi:hypothetical protein